MYPVMVPGVGVSVKSIIPAVGLHVRSAMEYAVNDITDGRNEKLLLIPPEKVKRHVANAREKAVQEVGGLIRKRSQ